MHQDIGELISRIFWRFWKMTLDFKISIKMGGNTTSLGQHKSTTTHQEEDSLESTTDYSIPMTILTCFAISIQILPGLNQMWDKLASPWQSFVESQLGKPGKVKAKNMVAIADGLSQDVQLVSEASLVPGDSVAGYPVTSGYGPRVSPCSGCSSYHAAIDVGTPTGTPLYAPWDTEVQCPNYGGLAGLVAEFPSPEGAYTVQFLHLHDCTPGAAKKGQKIAESGDAGTGPHLDLRLKDKNGDRPIPSKELLEKVLKP